GRSFSIDCTAGRPGINRCDPAPYSFISWCLADLCSDDIGRLCLWTVVWLYDGFADTRTFGCFHGWCRTLAAVPDALRWLGRCRSRDDSQIQAIAAPARRARRLRCSGGVCLWSADESVQLAAGGS